MYALLIGNAAHSILDLVSAALLFAIAYAFGATRNYGMSYNKRIRYAFWRSVYALSSRLNWVRGLAHSSAHLDHLIFR